MTIRQQFAPIRCSYSSQSLRELARENDNENTQAFIAQPVPPSTHEPLYAHIVEEGKQRRDELQKELVDYYQNVRPCRVPQFRRHRCLSADWSKKRLFHAKPVPSYPPQARDDAEQKKLQRMSELLTSVKEPGYLEVRKTPSSFDFLRAFTTARQSVATQTFLLRGTFLHANHHASSAAVQAIAPEDGRCYHQEKAPAQARCH